MHQVLALFQYASRLDRRSVSTAVAVVVTLVVVAAFIFWAPIERAELVVNLIAPGLAAVVAALAVEWWRRHHR